MFNTDVEIVGKKEGEGTGGERKREGEGRGGEGKRE